VEQAQEWEVPPGCVRVRFGGFALATVLTPAGILDYDIAVHPSTGHPVPGSENSRPVRAIALPAVCSAPR